MESLPNEVLKSLHRQGGKKPAFKALLKLREEINDSYTYTSSRLLPEKALKIPSQVVLCATTKHTNLYISNGSYVSKKMLGVDHRNYAELLRTPRNHVFLY